MPEIKKGDKRHITRGRYHEIYKIPPTKMVWSGLKNSKSKDVKTNYNSYNGKKKRKRKPRKR
jgi:hypothetical protein